MSVLSLHARKDDFSLRANQSENDTQSTAVVTYLLDQNGDYLTDQSGNYLIGDPTYTYQGRVRLSALKDDFTLRA